MPCGGFGERVVNTMAESKNYIVQPQEGGNLSLIHISEPTRH